MSLITVPELHETLDEVDVFDLRWELTDPSAGRSRYLGEHIPGAVYVDVETDLSTEKGPGRHPLPPPEVFAVTLGRLGIGPHADVVAYDESGGSIAARLWWMLEAIGHRGRVRVLDGGWQAWLHAGYETESGEVTPTPRQYPPPPHGYRGVVTLEDLRNRADTLLLDARAPERYRGETEPVDPRAGHIPGAVNAPWQDNLTDGSAFKDPTDLRRQYEALGAARRPVVVSCGSGVTSCHTALALHLAGLPRPGLYVGSFSEWSRSDLPVETE